MKALITVLIIVGAVGGGFYLLLAKVNQDPGYAIPVAFGAPAGGEVEMNVAVSMLMPRREEPKLGRAGLLWDEWVGDHFDLRDAAGTKLPLKRSDFSQLMTERQAGGTPEFFLITKLRPGQSYTFDYIPVMPAPRYRYAFTAPSAAKKAEWLTFKRYDGR
ncbi:MAG TPA: hypothetical protein VGM03_12645 [Phycisphaerae bacterium]